MNLVLFDVVKSVSDAGDFSALLHNIYSFVSGSAVHKKWLADHKELYPQEKA